METILSVIIILVVQIWLYYDWQKSKKVKDTKKINPIPEIKEETQPLTVDWSMMESNKNIMQNLIQLKQEYLIECDHCDFKIKNNSKDPNQSIEAYLNKPCSKCGKNLLKEKDYADYKRTMKIINWLNKWLSWLTIFSSKNGYKAKGTITIHNDVKLESK